MAGAMEEMDAAIELAQWAARDLKKKTPEHELLRFAGDDNLAFAMVPPPAGFVEQFAGKHIPEVYRGTEFAAAAMFDNYYRALKAAIETSEPPPSSEMDALCEVPDP